MRWEAGDEPGDRLRAAARRWAKIPAQFHSKRTDMIFRLRRLTAAALFFCLAAPTGYAQAPAVAPASPPDAATLARRVDEYMQAQHKVKTFHGSILLGRAGIPLVAKGYGFANAEWEIPNTPSTKFRVGSITKQFTSMLVLQLQEQGKLKVQDPVCRHLSPCPEPWRPITIHHLLTHTSGIPSYTGLPTWAATMMVPKTIDEMVGLFRDLPLEFEPGSKFKYNNSGYFLLGVLIEKVAGKTYQEVLRTQILEPLGLKDTGYDTTRDLLPRRASGYTRTATGVANAPYLDMLQPYSAGALYSTVEDLLKWEQALDTDTLIPAAARKAMFTPFKDNYAYGWTVRPPSAATYGRQRIAHGGGINGFSSMLIRVPDDKLTVVVLSNVQESESSRIANDLLSIALGRPYEVPSAGTALPNEAGKVR
jgi:CubicO group peptidase (beta-lactamase class C family)